MNEVCHSMSEPECKAPNSRTGYGGGGGGGTFSVL